MFIIITFYDVYNLSWSKIQFLVLEVFLFLM